MWKVESGKDMFILLYIYFYTLLRLGYVCTCLKSSKILMIDVVQDGFDKTPLFFGPPPKPQEILFQACSQTCYKAPEIPYVLV